MEKKNMVLLTVIAVATLLVAVVGATFAYFTATVTDNYSSNNDSGKTEVSSSNIAGTLTFASSDSNAGKFTAEDVYPGHTEVATIKVTVDGTEGQQSAVRLGYSVTSNDFATSDLKVYVFKSDSEIKLDQENALKCVKQTGTGSDTDAGKTTYFETCSDWTNKTTNALVTGSASLLAEKDVPQSSTTILVDRDVITIDTGTSKTAYYYVVIEFPNKESSQNDTSMGKKLEGNITVTAA